MTTSNDRIPRWRSIAARILVVVGVLVATISIAAGYLRWQAFDDDTFDETAGELIESDSVRAQIADAAVEALFRAVDIEAELEGRLPSDQQRLAGLFAAGVREVADRAADELLERPRGQALWRESVSTAHAELVALLRGEAVVFRVSDRGVVLDLRPLIVQLAERLSIATDLALRLPEDVALIRIMDANGLDRAQDLTALFEEIAPWIWLVAVILWAVAVWLARGRRRIELRAIALGLVTAGVLVLAARSLAGRYVIDALATTTTVHDASEDAWRIVTRLLADGAWAAIAVGLVALAGVWVAGPTASGAAVRRWSAPALARAELSYGILAVLFVLFVWWGPFVQARRPSYLAVTALLLILGVETLRRSTAREYPDAARTEPRELLRSLTRLQRSPARTTSLVGELERLARLHEEGALSDPEFVAAKSRLLAD